jgi:hypothetical protein
LVDTICPTHEDSMALFLKKKGEIVWLIRSLIST